MRDALSLVEASVDASCTYQQIDGFGVNINSKYWGQGQLAPVVDRLIDDLGATLFRVDIYGKSNWVDPTGERGPAVLDESTYADLYRGETFRNGWGLMRHLNRRGIRPYLTASGDVPSWMLASDGKRLAHYDSFVAMMVSLVEWARRQEGIDFSLFGPLNETDIGSPEGPTVEAEAFVEVAERLAEALERRGLGDVRLVLAEQARFDERYLAPLVRSARLRERIGVLALHVYGDLPGDLYERVVAVASNAQPGCRLWVTEFGDLDETGEKEWYVAWAMASRLFDILSHGFNGALAWDAFDNYHDHDESWSLYGLLRVGIRTYTPKKRYHAMKQIFRFVRPGFERIGVGAAGGQLRLLAFASPDRRDLTLVGMNPSPQAVWLRLSRLPQALPAGSLRCYRTDERENCALAGEHGIGAHDDERGLEVLIPGESIFTLTSVS